MRTKLIMSIAAVGRGVKSAIATAVSGSADDPPARKPTGLFAQLTDEQKRAFLAYDGPIEGGDPSLPRVK